MCKLTCLAALMCLAAFGAEVKDESAVAREQAKHYRIYRGDGQPATLDELISASTSSAVTFLGELHDDPTGHYLEQEILRRAHRPDLALSMEMFETDVQPVMDEYLSGSITEEHLVASGRAWGNYKTDYRPLVEFAREHKMAVIAANPPRRYVNRVTRLGELSLPGLTADARRLLPPLPYAAASPRYAEKFQRVMDEAEKAQAKASDGKDGPKQPPRSMDRVKGLQAQSLWDAGMAFSIADFLTRHPGMRVLQCNGSFHSAEKLGIPEHLARYRPGTSMLVVTMVSEKAFPNFPSEARGHGDFVIVTDPKLPRTSSAAFARKRAAESGK